MLVSLRLKFLKGLRYELQNRRAHGADNFSFSLLAHKVAFTVTSNEHEIEDLKNWLLESVSDKNFKGDSDYLGRLKWIDKKMEDCS